MRTRGARGRAGCGSSLEVIRAIKQEVGPEFPLTLRISGYERVPGGRSLEETQAMAPELEAAGVDAFHVSGGVIDPLTTQMVTGSHFGDGHNVAAAAAVKRVVDAPVIAVGRIHDPKLAERILAGRPRRPDRDGPARCSPIPSSRTRRAPAASPRSAAASPASTASTRWRRGARAAP